METLGLKLQETRRSFGPAADGGVSRGGPERGVNGWAEPTGEAIAAHARELSEHRAERWLRGNGSTRLPTMRVAPGKRSIRSFTRRISDSQAGITRY